jgi:riboflavin biosynthesis pyrimidine reductase
LADKKRAGCSSVSAVIGESPLLTTWLDRADGTPLPLSPALLAAYGGPLGFPSRSDAPHVVASFVSTVDGVTSFALAEANDAGAISGFHREDVFVLALLRACADAIVVGAETVRECPSDYRWTAEHAFPEAAEELAALRRALGKPEAPVTVAVSASGRLDRSAAGLVVLTTGAGAGRLSSPTRAHTLGDAPFTAGAILDAVLAEAGAELVLVEGGARTLAPFVAERRLDELFLTVAPQLVGRNPARYRPSLFEGVALDPDDAAWARLVSAKLSTDHLFLRYRFSPTA